MQNNNKIKLGICHWSLPIEGPYACKMASELGFKGIQLDIGSYERGLPLSKKSVQSAYTELAEQYGIEFPSIAVRITDDYSMIKAPDADESKIVMETIVKSIETAGAMKIPTVMIPSFLASDIKNEDDMSRLADVLKFACTYAQAMGITIATENLLNAEEAFRLFDVVDKPNLKLYYDTQNYHLFRGYDAPALLENLQAILCNEIHIKDGKNGVISSSLLGDGDSEWIKSMDVVKKIDFSGWLILENYYDRRPLSFQNEDPVALIKEDIERVKQLWKEVVQ